MAGGRRLEKQLQVVSWRLLVRTRRRGVGEIRITRARVVDVRFPTSLESVGSDAVNLAPDYSAAYCVLETDAAPPSCTSRWPTRRAADVSGPSSCRPPNSLSRCITARTTRSEEHTSELQ